MVGAPDTPAQLVQLGQTELVGTVNDNGIGVGNIDAGFNDGGAHQHIVTLVVEIGHDLLKLTLTHLAMTGDDTRFGDQGLQITGGFLYGLHLVVQIVDLSAAQ